MSAERRSFPRYPVKSPVLVTLPDAATGTVYHCECNTLSRTSIQIECSAELIAALLRQTKLPYYCSLQFTLPWYKHIFRVDASVVTHRRLSRQQYVLVLLLRHADLQQETLLDNQLNRQQKALGLD
ncbi:MAG: hypothetical protein RLZZ227_131 [Pseudomonadota bacterium]|jgi:hypothetical protein